jgi:DNA-binding MarR family transcriptional regulator
MSASQDFELCGLRAGEGLDYRQREVLSALSEDQKATYSFQGLRRKLGFHQEMLSRTLDRLEEEKLVEKTHDGYRINTKVNTADSDYVAEVTPIETQVVTAHLPLKTDVNIILNTLKGRWFADFRWLGYSQTPSGATLSWITEDGRIQLRAKIFRGILTINALYPSRTDEERAIRSAFELFDFVTRQNPLPPRHEILN